MKFELVFGVFDKRIVQSIVDNDCINIFLCINAIYVNDRELILIYTLYLAA